MTELRNQYSEEYKTDIRLDSAKGVRQLLGRVATLRINDKIDSQTCRDVGYLCNILLTAYKVGDLEEKIEELERHLNLDL